MKYNALWLCFILLLSATALSQQDPATLNASKPLLVDQAFQFSAAARDTQTIIARWIIKPHYYLYRSSLHFRIIKPKGLQFGTPLFPSKTIKLSTVLGRRFVYEGTLRLPIPILGTSSNTRLLFEAQYQGCSHFGYCYPPLSRIVVLDLSASDPSHLQFFPGLAIDVPDLPAAPADIQEEQNTAVRLLQGHSLWALLAGFFGLGLLISLTPCVLPMIPILSAIILGPTQVTNRRAFGLSVAYVLGMAMTYAIAGLLVGLIGGTVQATLQQPWVIISFSIVFLAMALSLFGFYNIQLPQQWRNKFAALSDHQKRGSFIGVTLMGAFSALILSPCVTPPLVAVLGYIAHTGNATLGGITLFTMGLGMGGPLLLIGASGRKLLPRTGNWMNAARTTMGIIMLGMAVWLLQRIIPTWSSSLLWAALIMGTAVYMGALSTATTRWGLLRKSIGLFLFICSTLLLFLTALSFWLAGPRITLDIGLLKPLQQWQQLIKKEQQQHLPFIPVKTIADVESQLSVAHKKGQPVLLDFYAEWCISCHAMDRTTFADPQVQTRLKSFMLLRADVTQNDHQDKALQQHFAVIAPPTLLFFRQGKEIKPARVVGELSANDLLAHLAPYRSLSPKGSGRRGSKSTLPSQ